MVEKRTTSDPADWLEGPGPVTRALEVSLEAKPLPPEYSTGVALARKLAATADLMGEDGRIKGRTDNVTIPTLVGLLRELQLLPPTEKPQEVKKPVKGAVSHLAAFRARVPG